MEQTHQDHDADELSAPRRLSNGLLDKDSIEEFKRLWKEEFGEELSDGQAQMTASILIELYLRLAGGMRDRVGEDDRTN